MLTENEGVKAIQFLLKLYGGSEPTEVSRKNWRNMKDWEKESTEKWYNRLKGKVNNVKLEKTD